MELDIGTLNCFYIGATVRPHAILTSATKEEFEGLLESYTSEIELQDVRLFNVLSFVDFVTKNGYYIKTGNHDLQAPDTP